MINLIKSFLNVWKEGVEDKTKEEDLYVEIPNPFSALIERFSATPIKRNRISVAS